MVFRTNRREEESGHLSLYDGHMPFLAFVLYLTASVRIEDQIEDLTDNKDLIYVMVSKSL